MHDPSQSGTGAHGEHLVRLGDFFPGVAALPSRQGAEAGELGPGRVQPTADAPGVRVDTAGCSFRVAFTFSLTAERKSAIQADAERAAENGVKWFDACPFSWAHPDERAHWDACYLLAGGVYQ